MLIVTGEGDRAFMGGANLHELGELNPAKARDFLTLIHRMCKVLRDLPVPVIARVNGFCLGAGLEVMAACDMHIASDNAVFGMPEVKIGLPSVVEAALLPQLIGWGRTRLLLLHRRQHRRPDRAGLGSGGESRSAAGAGCRAWISWVNSIVESGPKAIRLQKELIREWEAMPVNEAIEAGIRCISRAYQIGGANPHGRSGDRPSEGTQDSERQELISQVVAANSRSGSQPRRRRPVSDRDPKRTGGVAAKDGDLLLIAQ